MDISLIFENWRGWYILIVPALTVLFFFLIAFNKKFKSSVIFAGVNYAFFGLIVWFLGGVFYADMWRYSKYGTWSGNIPLPEYFDGASMGFLVAGIVSFAFLFWVIRASKIRGGNDGIDFNV